MVESADDYITRKMSEVQNLIQDATDARAMMNPIITDGFDTQLGAIITISIRIHESKLHEYKKIQSR